MSNIFISTKNSKTSDSNRFRLLQTKQILGEIKNSFIRLINSLHLVQHKRTIQ